MSARKEATAEHAFEREEAAGRDADAIDIKTWRARDGQAPYRRLGGGEAGLRRAAERPDADPGRIRDGRWRRRAACGLDAAYLNLRLLLFARLVIDLFFELFSWALSARISSAVSSARAGV